MKTVKLTLAEVQGSTKWLPKTNRPLNLVLDLYTLIICRNSENNRELLPVGCVHRYLPVAVFLTFPWWDATHFHWNNNSNLIWDKHCLCLLSIDTAKHSSFSGALPNPFHAWFQTPRAQRWWVQKDSLCYKTRCFFPPPFSIFSSI